MTSRSSNSTRLCMAEGYKRAPSKWDRHNQMTAGNRVLHKSSSAVAVLRRTGVSIPSSPTIQTNRLLYYRNLFNMDVRKMRYLVTFVVNFNSKLLECHLSTVHSRRLDFLKNYNCVAERPSRDFYTSHLSNTKGYGMKRKTNLFSDRCRPYGRCALRVSLHPL